MCKKKNRCAGLQLALSLFLSVLHRCYLYDLNVQLQRFLPVEIKKKERENNNNLLLSFRDILKAKLGASPLVRSPWDQSGWRCERGRCRCSRSQQRGELHRPSRASRARPTHGAPTRVASAGAAAVAAPGRSPSPAQELALSWPSVAQRGPAWQTLLHTE